MAYLAATSRRTGFLAAAAAALGMVLLATQVTLAAEDTSIRPFEVHIPDETIAELRERLAETRWPDKETVDDRSQGIQLANLRVLVNYWATDYDWRRAEAQLNALPQFVTSIDGVDIYFIHVKSKHPDALPMIITHGWPGSVFEMLEVIGPLTDPTAHGGTAEDAFDVVIPAIPGYGFSGKPTGTGWGPDRIAATWATLMDRLGYTRYMAQGGDWGSPITQSMAHQQPEGLVGVHLNLPSTLPPDVAAALAGGPVPEGMTDEETVAFDKLLKSAMAGNSAYNAMMTAKPQTIGFGVTDSPAFLAAWMLGHPGFGTWNFGNDPEQTLTKDQVLDDFTLYWVTNSAASAGRLYWENMGRGILPAAAQNTSEIKLPVAITVFGEDNYRPPESWARRAYPSLIYFHDVDDGGHFASWEQPELFSAELRAAFKSLR